jgi:hypothetical protein
MNETFFLVTDGRQVISPNFMVKLKRSICETLILQFHRTSEVRANFISFFLEAELLKLGVFGKAILNLS